LVNAVNSNQLVQAYERFIHLARTAAVREYTAGGADRIDWILAHVALHDDVLAGSARRVRDGDPTIIDTLLAMCADAVGEVIGRGSRPDLVDLVERNSARLISEVGQIPEHRADTLVQVRLTSRTGHRRFDGWLVWRDLIRLRAEEQIPEHCRRLEQESRGSLRTDGRQ
jgi:hypothetical protein